MNSYYEWYEFYNIFIDITFDPVFRLHGILSDKIYSYSIYWVLFLFKLDCLRRTHSVSY